MGQLALLGETQTRARAREDRRDLPRAGQLIFIPSSRDAMPARPQPEGEREREAIDQAVSIWHALWEQYSACLKPLLEGDNELEGVKAKILQRGLFVGKQLVLVHGLARRATPPETLAGAPRVLPSRRDARLCRHRGDRRPHSAGCWHVVLLDLQPRAAARPGRSLRDERPPDRARRPLASASGAASCFRTRSERESETGRGRRPRQHGGREARPRGAARRAGGDSLRLPGQAARPAYAAGSSVSTGGAAPAELQLGHDVSTEQCIALLRTSKRGGATCRAVRAKSEDAELDLVTGGLLAAFFRVGGRTFERADPIGRTFQKAQHLKTLGALTDYDRFREEARA